MSNDEYKTSLVNYNNHNYKNNHYCIGPTTKTTNNNQNNFYETVFHRTKTSSDKNFFHSSNELDQKPLLFKQQTDDVNNNNTNKRSEPMNLITNTGLDLSHHSIRKPNIYNNTISHTTSSTTSSSSSSSNFYQNTSSSTRSYTDTYAFSPTSSSSSSSIDVENDIKDKEATLDVEHVMSPVSIPTQHQQRPLIAETRNPSAFTTMELTASSIPSPFPLNYQQLYASNTALYGTPIMFSGAIHAAHASYMAGLPLHAALSPNETYLKAIQAAACGIYSPRALAPPPAPSAALALVPPSIVPPTSSLNCKPSPPTLHKTTTSNIMTLAPSNSTVSSAPVVITKSPQHQQCSPNLLTGSTGSHNEHEQQKNDYQAATLISSQTRVGCSNSSGTYLNDKVNERLSASDAAKDSHFKVPNGKEGSLKHRILRPNSNGETASESNKIPVMRTYSTTSSFKKGNYIELANGALRRVEDMRTEDFIQCAERSPYHQLAESTVVKINTSLPSTAVITFSYDRNRSKVDMEVSVDHPFFVYGQGWASCNPELSLKMFGLKCQRLQVGDICISLTRREQTRQQTFTPPNNTNTAVTPPAQVNDSVNYQRRPTMTVTSPNSSCNEMPSSYSHAFTMPIAQPTTSHHLQQQQQAYAEMAKLMSSYAYANSLPQIPHEQLKEVVMDAPNMMNAFYQSQIFQFTQQQEHLRQAEFSTKNSQTQERSSAISSAHYNNAVVVKSIDLEQQSPPQTQPLDVTMSRKRRWSAPENMFDDDESETQPPRNGSSPATASRS